MQVTCPGCQSRFLLPQGVKNGARLRCSVCRTEFSYEAPAVEENPVPAPAAVPDERPLSFDKAATGGSLPEYGKPRKHGGGRLWLILLVLVCAGCVIAWQTVPEFRGQVMQLKQMIMPGASPTPPKSVRSDQAARQSEQVMLILRDVRHYFVTNEQIGQVLVVEGNVFNQGLEPRANVSVEAALINKARQVTASAVQKAGVRLSAFQLKVMSKAEIDAALNNEKEIALTNSKVLPGGQVPFMVVFFSPTQDVAEFAAKVRSSDPVIAGQSAQPESAPAQTAPVPAPAQVQPEQQLLPPQTPAEQKPAVVQ